MPLREEGAKEEGAVAQNCHISSTSASVPNRMKYVKYNAQPNLV